MPRAEPQKEISVYPTKPKASVHRVQRISRLPLTTANPDIDSGVRILLNTYLASKELRVLEKLIDKWQKSPTLVCETILETLRRIGKDSNWAVVYGNFYCQSAAPNDLCVFASHRDRHMAIVRGSWKSGTVA